MFNYKCLPLLREAGDLYLTATHNDKYQTFYFNESIFEQFCKLVNFLHQFLTFFILWKSSHTYKIHSRIDSEARICVNETYDYEDAILENKLHSLDVQKCETRKEGFKIVKFKICLPNSKILQNSDFIAAMNCSNQIDRIYCYRRCQTSLVEIAFSFRDYTKGCKTEECFNSFFNHQCMFVIR